MMPDSQLRRRNTSGPRCNHSGPVGNDIARPSVFWSSPTIPEGVCLPKTLSGMTVGWSCGNEATDGRVSDPAAACDTVAVHAASAA
jgi:hypothetical protein